MLQTPKTLSLQQCLSVVRHYESLKLHIQQIRPDKSIEYLRQCHSGKKKGSGQPQSNNFNQNQNQRGCSQSQLREGTWNQSHNQTGGQSQVIQVNICQATNVSVLAEIDILIGYMNVLHRANPAISVVDYITLNLYVA